MTGPPPTLADLMAAPVSWTDVMSWTDVTCLDRHHNTTMPVAALLPRYAAETPFPDVWGGFRCSAYGSRRAAQDYSALSAAAGNDMFHSRLL